MYEKEGIDKATVEDAQSKYNLAVSDFSKGVAVGLYKSSLNTRRISTTALADAFHALESKEVATEANPADGDAAKWWSEFLNSNEGKSIRAKTVGNPHVAELACVSIAEKLRDHLTQQKYNSEAKLTPFQELLKTQASIEQIGAQCDEDVNDAVALVSSISYGLTGQVSPGSSIDKDLFEQIFDRVRKSKALREILKLAGAMTKFRGAKRKKRIEGPEIVNGVEFNGELSRLTQTEIMNLADPDRELDLMRRIVERQALCYEKYAEEKQGNGPMVIVLDESGSMEGDNICQAKAFALTMARVAAQEKRWVYFVSFGDVGHIQEHLFKPEDWKTSEGNERLLKYMDSFMNSWGTCFNVLTHVANNWAKMKAPSGKTDMYIVTDCQAHLSPKLVESFNKWRADNDVKCYGLAVQSGVGNLPLVCDQAWPTQSMGLESSAVREIIAR
jgi:uncharacterized protein with von Willebrand factor type A (vWA) domain